MIHGRVQARSKGGVEMSQRARAWGRNLDLPIKEEEETESLPKGTLAALR